MGDESLEKKQDLPLGDKIPGTTTTTTPNLQGCVRKTTATRFMDTARIMDKSRIMETAITMVIKDYGQSKDHGHN